MKLDFTVNCESHDPLHLENFKIMAYKPCLQDLRALWEKSSQSQLNSNLFNLFLANGLTLPSVIFTI